MTAIAAQRRAEQSHLWKDMFHRGWPFLSARGASFAMAFVTFAVVARYLGPERFGIYSFAYNLPMLLGPLVDFGFSAVATREIARGATTRWALSGIAASVTTLPFVWIVLALGSWLVGLRGADLSLVFIGSAQLLVLPCRSLESWLVAKKRTLALGQFGVLANAVSLGCVMLVTALRLPISFVLLAHMSSLILYYSIVAAAVLKTITKGERTGLTNSRVWSDAWPIGLGGVFASFTERSGMTIVFLISGARAAGLFSSAFRFYEVIVAVAGVAMTVAFPYLAEVGADQAAFARRVLALLRTAIAMSGALAIWFAGVAPLLVTTAFGGHYREAAPLLVALAPAIANVLPANLIAYSGISGNRRAHFLAGAAAAAVTAVVGGVALVTMMGPAGMALALALAGVVSVLVISSGLPIHQGASPMTSYLILYSVWGIAFVIVVAIAPLVATTVRVAIAVTIGTCYAVFAQRGAAIGGTFDHA